MNKLTLSNLHIFYSICIFSLITYSVSWKKPAPTKFRLRVRNKIPEPGKLYRSGVSPRIVGGRPVRFGEAPYHMRLYEDREWQCGASLVNYRGLHFVITAAHCVWDGARNATHISGAVIPPIALQFCGADLDMLSYQEREQWFGALGVIIHDSYDPSLCHHDIALVFLETYAFESLGLAPIPLPGRGWDDPNEFRVTGHGGKWHFDENRYLQIIELTPIERKKCRVIYKETNPDSDWTVTDNMMCGGHPIEWVKHGTCFGDSGGPAIGFNYSVNDWYLSGLVSWSNFETCGTPKAFTVFTKISNYIPWIKRIATDWIDEFGTGNPYTNGTPTHENTGNYFE